MSIYFWKPHQNDGYLGNWYPSPFTVDNKKFLNSEHYFMWKKVMLFDPSRFLVETTAIGLGRIPPIKNL